MVKIIIFLLVVVCIVYIMQSHLHIDFRSFFKRGFKKIDNKFGLYCYCGVQGEGKTYSAVAFCNKLVKDYHYRVITNVTSYKAFTNTIYEYDILKLIDFITKNHNKNGQKYVIFFDEIFTILMKGQAVNQDILAFLAQLRKREVIFVTTAQNWGEIPLTFRRFCRFQVLCHMISIPLINTAFTINKICDGYNARWSDEIQDFQAPIIQTNFAKGNKDIINCYDTFETINVVKLPTQRKY